MKVPVNRETCFLGWVTRVDQRNTQFQRTLEAGINNLKSLLAICRWQSAQRRWFLHEDPHHNSSRNTKALQAVESVLEVPATTTKQFGTFMTDCHPIVVELAASVKDHEQWKKSLELLTTWKLDRLWKRSAQRREMRTNLDTPTTTCRLECHWTRNEVPGSYLDEAGLKTIGTRWIYTNTGDAANPFQETQRASELTPEDACSTFASTLPLESLKFMCRPQPSASHDCHQSDT